VGVLVDQQEFVDHLPNLEREFQKNEGPQS
jgi:hypothetical protein